MKQIIVLLISIFLIFSGCADTQKDKNNEVIVFAAASLGDVVGELAQIYHKKHGVTVRLNMASSGILARQLEQGAPCDVYLSANGEWMDHIQNKGIIDSLSRIVLARNTLVLIIPNDEQVKEFDFNHPVDLPGSFIGRLSIGDPSHVPSGSYALQVLNYYQWADELKNRLLPAKDARDALMMVEMGEARMGIVYLSDAKKSQRVKIVGIIPTVACSPILYHGVLCQEASLTGKKFFNFICGKQAREVWVKSGFLEP